VIYVHAKGNGASPQQRKDKAMKNEFFESMYKAGCEYQEKRDAAEKQRDALYAEEKYDEGTDLMVKFNDETPFPFTNGAMKAFQAYQNTNYRGADCFEVEDLPWPKDMKDFVDTLRKAGIRTITVNDQSTGLMEGIYGLAENGCRMGALRTVTREKDHRFGSDEPERKNGIEFTIA
jgi:hypothetical protein